MKKTLTPTILGIAIVIVIIALTAFTSNHSLHFSR